MSFLELCFLFVITISSALFSFIGMEYLRKVWYHFNNCLFHYFADAEKRKREAEKEHCNDENPVH